MPTFADTDGSTLKFVEELTYGAGPAANSILWKTARATSWNIKPVIGTLESEEISANVDVLDAITHAKMGQFSMAGHYCKDTAFETLLEHIFRGAFATNVLKGGVLKKSLSFEELTVGTANEFGRIDGVRLDNFSMSGSVGRPMEVSLQGSGGTVTLGATSAVGTGTVAAAGTNRFLSLADMTAFSMVGDTTPLVVLDMNLSIANATREQMGAGSTSLQGIGYGTRRVSGSFTAYFETREQLAKVLSGVKQDLSFTLTDGTNSHIWRLPALKFLDGDKPVGGRSNDITQKIEFLGTFNAAQATTAMVTRS